MSQQPPVRSTGSPPAASRCVHVAADQRDGAQPRRRLRGGGGPAGGRGRRDCPVRCGPSSVSPPAWCWPPLVVTVGAAEARISAPVVAKERAGAHRPDRGGDRGGRRSWSGRRQAPRRGGRAAAEGTGDSTAVTRPSWSALLSGATPVHGPGVKLVVDDAKDTDQRWRRAAGEQRLLRHGPGARPGHAARRQRAVGVGRRGGRRSTGSG